MTSYLETQWGVEVNRSIGQNFLTIRPWEPKFNALEATCDRTTIWSRLPGLPFEFYDKILLAKIGNSLGTLIKIDAHPNDELRGQYAKLCIQVEVTKPLQARIRLGDHVQNIVYEVVNHICFNCGRLGHLNTVCAFSNTPHSLVCLDL